MVHATSRDARISVVDAREWEGTTGLVSGADALGGKTAIGGPARVCVFTDRTTKRNVVQSSSYQVWRQPRV